MKISNIYVAGAIAGLFASGVAHADATWQMWDNTSPVACSQTYAGTTVNSVTNIGNAYSCSAASTDDPTMTVTAWSTTGSGSTFAGASVRRWDWTPDVTGTPIVGQTSGYDYGVINSSGNDSSSPNHSLDNSYGKDALALDFGNKEVALSSVSLGWYQQDADISVLRYTGNASSLAEAMGVGVVGGRTVSTLVSNGWELVGHYVNLQNDMNAPSRTAEIQNAGASSWWLVAAYSSSYGTATGAHGGATSGFDSTKDYMKLLQVAGTVAPAGCTSNCGGSQVPEPGGLALVGLGFAGMIFSRRKAKLAA